MKKNSILILMPYFECGGVESTLLSLLDELDREKYEITLALLEKKGRFLDRIPNDIRIEKIEIPEREWGIFFGKKKILMSFLKKGKFGKLPYFVKYNLKHTLTEDRTKNAQYFHEISKSIPKMNKEYDLAIDYFGYATFTTFYLAEKVNAKRKITWLHSILSRFNPRAFGVWYQQMDQIFACSKMVKEDFEEMFPEIKKVAVFYNIINPNEIKEKANLAGGFEDDFDGIRILTVGRICKEKGTDIAARVYNQLRKNYNIRWYIVGDGSESDKELVRKEIDEDKTIDFVFLGIQENPYVYMKQCDIYVQPSRFEGYCTTTNEARIVGCPIVMTDVSGAREQLANGVNGYIVKGEDDLINAIEQLIQYPDLRKELKNHIKQVNCDTRMEINKLLRGNDCE